MYCNLAKIHRDITYFEKALEVTDNKYLKALDHLGQYYYSKKNFEKSKFYFLQAVKLNDMDLNAWTNLGYIYMNEKDFPLAISSFKKALFIHEKIPELWANISNLLR